MQLEDLLKQIINQEFYDELDGHNFLDQNEWMLLHVHRFSTGK